MNDSATPVPGHVTEAEQAVLGAMMLSTRAIGEVTEILRPEHFYHGHHRVVFTAIVALYEAGGDVDTITVLDRLEADGDADSVGYGADLADMVSMCPSTANAESYARTIRRAARVRQTQTDARELVRLSSTPGADQADITRIAERIAVGQDDSNQGPEHLRNLLSETMAGLEALYERDGSVHGLPTGFRDLDALTSGLQGGTVTVFAARPAMGKSTLVTNIAAHVSVAHRTPTLLFSLEMSGPEIVSRIFAAEGPLSSERLRTGKLTDSDWAALSNAVGRLAEAPLWIDDTASLSLAQVRARARRMQSVHGLGLIIVDYLQLMDMAGMGHSRQEQVAAVTRALKILAKELDVPVVVLSQLSRKVEERDNKRPRLSDLRESGAIEQDADVVAFLYRDDVYEPLSPDVGVAELIVAKHRNGALETVRLDFDGDHFRFTDRDESTSVAPGGYAPVAAPEPVGVAGGWGPSGGEVPL